MDAKFKTILSELIDREFAYPEVEWETVKQYKECQQAIREKFSSSLESNHPVEVNYKQHTKFLTTHLFEMSEFYQSLDSSRVWMAYWILHSLELLDITIEIPTCKKITQFLQLCLNDDGGFGGGPGQHSHLASTYAGVMCVCMIGLQYPEAYEIIDRLKLKNFIASCGNSDGSFNLSPSDETDARAIYCAIVVSKITNIFCEDLFVDSVNYLKSCQNYDGGFGSKTGVESNGAYTFCAYISLVLLNKENRVDQSKLLNWIVHRQLSFEGGFNGRPNKLVDSCYSYWCGAVYSILESFDEVCLNKMCINLYDKAALEAYLLSCCQSNDGGFSSRPLVFTDFYHTCYSLSALSLSQNSMFERLQHCYSYDLSRPLLEPNNAIYNITTKAYLKAFDYYYKL